MANIQEFGTYWIAEHWVIPLEYGDYTGLNEEEIGELTAFLETLPRCPMFEFGGEGGLRFVRDEIGDTLAGCLKLIVFHDLALGAKP